MEEAESALAAQPTWQAPHTRPLDRAGLEEGGTRLSGIYRIAAAHGQEELHQFGRGVCPGGGGNRGSGNCGTQSSTADLMDSGGRSPQGRSQLWRRNDPARATQPTGRQPEKPGMRVIGSQTGELWLANRRAMAVLVSRTRA